MIIWTILPYIISFLIGFFLIQNLLFHSKLKNQTLLHLIIGFGVGLSISSTLTFFSFIVFNQYHKNFSIISNLVLLGFLVLIYIFRLFKHKASLKPKISFSIKDFILTIIYFILLIPALYWATFFLDGGWDAWSTWNLKAKFLYLGKESWINVFDPILWRSSPHYPLLLPLINVWGWSFQTKPIPEIPLITSLIFLILTTGLLFTGLKKFISSRWAFICAVLLLLHPYYMRIAMSQYCDIVLSFYLLAGIICLLISKKDDSRVFAILAGLNFGSLTFTKPEGMVAAAILILLCLWYFLKLDVKGIKNKILSWLYLFYGFLIGIIPTLIFQLSYSPGNQTMINGLVSIDKPSTIERLDVIWKFYLVELLGDISPWKGIVIGSWHGAWLMLMIGFVISLFNKGRTFDSLIRIVPIFIFGYMSVITFYYYMNTYFPIAWWLQVTLHRIVFSLLPLVIFWIFYSVWVGKKSIN